MQLAVQAAQPKIIRILAKHGANLESLDKEGLTPLLNSINAACARCVEVLLHARANPEAIASGYVKDRTRVTPLLLAVDNMRIKIARLLLAERADVNRLTSTTPLAAVVSRVARKVVT